MEYFDGVEAPVGYRPLLPLTLRMVGIKVCAHTDRVMRGFALVAVIGPARALDLPPELGCLRGGRGGVGGLL